MGAEGKSAVTERQRHARSARAIRATVRPPVGRPPCYGVGGGGGAGGAGW